MIRKGFAFALTCAGLLLPAAVASANHSGKDIHSIGPNGGNANVHAFFDAASADGLHVFFETTEPLVSSDTDGLSDIYERTNGVTTQVSVGPSGGNGPSDAFYDGVSNDGTKVFFDTDERLVPADTDNFIDVYMRSGGTTTLVSTGSTGGNGAFDVTFDGASDDGSHVFFETDEPLVPADTDNSTDIYDRSGGVTTLVTTGPNGGNGAFTPLYDGASADGSHVYFDSDEQLVAGDTDNQFDVYDRSGGTTTLVSTGPTGGNGALPARYQGNSSSGAKVWFETRESLAPTDTDPATCGPSANQTCNDVYERSGGTTTQISTGPAGGNGAFDATFDGASLDGTHVYFHTNEQMVGGDTDGRRDVYERLGGTTTQVSTGPSGGNGAIDAFFDAVSQDGSHVFFDTSESLIGTDTDTRSDVYDYSAGSVVQASLGSSGGNGAFDSFFEGTSQDGKRAFFSTTEQLEPTDIDASTDVYERFLGATTHISFGPNGGNGAFGAFLDGVSSDGRFVFFNTRESLISIDTDTTRDVYSASVDAYARPKGATPLRVSLVPAYQACTAGNRSHGAPLSFPSCAPPLQASSQLTIGSPDSNGAPVNSVGSARFDAVAGNPATPANEADLFMAPRITDVRQQGSLADYAGELQMVVNVRFTDRFNGTSQVDAGTGDTPISVTVPCATTSSGTIGSTCSVNTSLNSILPNAIVEQKRAILEFSKVDVFDGGSDGVASTVPNTLFETQGVLVP